jgi:hypothetical protein
MIELSSETAVQSASFSLGELPFRFETTDSHWLGLLERRYSGFPAESDAVSFTIRFAPTAVTLPGDLASPLAVHLEELRCSPAPYGYRVETETSSCDIDLLARRAEIRGPSAMYPLDNLLRHLLPILWRDGVIVHAAALVAAGGRGILASGPSGAGTSTFAGLAADRSLCDELSAVRLDGRAPLVVSLPFWKSRPGRAPLHAILVLEHGGRHRLEPLSPGAALRRLSTQILWPVWDETAMARSFAHLSRLVESVPSFVFSFAPRPDAIAFLEEQIP